MIKFRLINLLSRENNCGTFIYKMRKGLGLAVPRRSRLSFSKKGEEPLTPGLLLNNFKISCLKQFHEKTTCRKFSAYK